MSYELLLERVLICFGSRIINTILIIPLIVQYMRYQNTWHNRERVDEDEYHNQKKTPSHNLETKLQVQVTEDEF